MDLLQAIILGAVQGLTEFIPISSSAHLIVIPWLLGWESFGLTFDVALHLGTLLALLAYFWRDWYGMIRDSLSATKLGRWLGMKRSTGTMLLWPIVIATVPAALAGKFLEETVENRVRSSFLLVAVVTIGLGIFLLLADRYGAKRRAAESVTVWDWLIIGVAQALAIIPGVSRSGVTITAGMAWGLQRDASARFSFLLGAPIILGAAVHQVPSVLRNGLGSSELLPFVVGIASSAIVGYLCIGFLMSYLRTRSAALFVVYRFVFGSMVIAFTLIR